MSAGGILVGLLNCVVLAIILVLIGAVVQYVMGALGWPIPPIVVKLFMALVAVMVLICLIQLLLGGAPMVHIFR